MPTKKVSKKNVRTKEKTQNKYDIKISIIIYINYNNI